MADLVNRAVAILKRSRSLKWTEGDVREFARQLRTLKESDVLKLWFGESIEPPSGAAAVAASLDKRLAALSRKVSAEKARLITLMVEFLHSNERVEPSFPKSRSVVASGPRFFQALCAEVGEAEALKSFSDFEEEIRQRSSRKYKLG